MGTKKVTADYGAGQLDIEVPDSAAVVEFKDPSFLPDPKDAVRSALAQPYGSPPLRDLCRPGMTVAIGFDDPTRPAIPVQTILPVLLEELTSAGIKEQDLLLICAPGNHRRYGPEDLETYLGKEIFHRFWNKGQIINHNCLDPTELKSFGYTKNGGYVEHNRRFVEADLMVYVGNVFATLWGGYTGTGVVVGLGSTRSIASHHAHRVIAHPASVALDEHSRAMEGHSRVEQISYGALKAEISAHLEKCLGKRVFYVNAVSGTQGRIAGIFAGHSPEVEPPARELADTFYRYPAPQADVLVVGLPQSFAYGSSHNQLIAAVGVLVPPRHWVNKPILREGGVVIGLCPSKGEIDPEVYPSYQEVADLYAQHRDARIVETHVEELGKRPEYIKRYERGNAYPPSHPFWLFNESEYALNRAGKILMVGATNRCAFNALGIETASSFEEAWRVAVEVAGSDPVTVVAPTFWSKRTFKFEVH